MEDEQTAAKNAGGPNEAEYRESMKFLLVVFVLLGEDWVRGDDLDGWGSIVYQTEEICLARKARAEQLRIDVKRANPRAHDLRFVCEPQGPGAKE